MTFVLNMIVVCIGVFVFCSPQIRMAVEDLQVVMALEVVQVDLVDLLGVDSVDRGKNLH